MWNRNSHHCSDTSQIPHGFTRSGNPSAAIMLTIVESKIIFLYISLFSTLAIIPFEIDPNHGRLGSASKCRRKLWCFFFGLSAVHSFHAMAKFLILLWSGGFQSVPLHTCVSQLGLSYASAAFLIITFLAVGRQSGLLAQMFNELYTSG